MNAAIFKNYGFKYVRQNLHIDSFYVAEKLGEFKFSIGLGVGKAANFVMRHKNLNQAAEVLKQLLANQPNLFYAIIRKTQNVNFPIEIDLSIFHNPLLLNYFQKTDIIEQTDKYSNTLFNFMPLSIFNEVAFRNNSIDLTVKKQFFFNDEYAKLLLIENYPLYYVAVNKNEVFLSYNLKYSTSCCGDEQKLNFVKALSLNLEKFQIYFDKKLIQFDLFNETISFNFNQCCDSFNSIIEDIFNSLENCKFLLHYIKTFKPLKIIADSNNNILNEIRKKFGELFEFLLDYDKFRKI